MKMICKRVGTSSIQTSSKYKGYNCKVGRSFQKFQSLSFLPLNLRDLLIDALTVHALLRVTFFEFTKMYFIQIEL